mmetsp:Transcript_16501/g.41889  ORF Transcript_16501/g.41889 Transcript_16501/m.41889 type:complete len:110 (-) Transcript_16501:1177-1506(-)
MDCHSKFIRVIAMWMIDGIAKEHWPMLGAAINMASQEWLRAFIRVASPKGVTPTMHTVVAHYGDQRPRLQLRVRQPLHHLHHAVRPPTHVHALGGDACARRQKQLAHQT